MEFFKETYKCTYNPTLYFLSTKPTGRVEQQLLFNATKKMNEERLNEYIFQNGHISGYLERTTEIISLNGKIGRKIKGQIIEFGKPPKDISLILD